MTDTLAEARWQARTNTPPIKSGQKWARKRDPAGEYPLEIRIVCRYPFATSLDGVLWIFESAMAYEHLERIPEIALRHLYELKEDVE